MDEYWRGRSGASVRWCNSDCLELQLDRTHTTRSADPGIDNSVHKPQNNKEIWRTAVMSVAHITSSQHTQLCECALKTWLMFYPTVLRKSKKAKSNYFIVGLKVDQRAGHSVWRTHNFFSYLNWFI